MSKEQLQYGYEDDGPNCLIGSHHTLFVRVQQTPHHNAVEYARKFAAVDDLLEALKGIVEDDSMFVSAADQKARWEQRMEAAKAAIAKAQGTQEPA